MLTMQQRYYSYGVYDQKAISDVRYEKKKLGLNILNIFDITMRNRCSVYIPYTDTVIWIHC
jgi:hypothetical protein